MPRISPHAVSVDLDGGSFLADVRGWSWGLVSDHDLETEATIGVEVRSVEHPARAIFGFLHGRLRREAGGGAFVCPLGDNHMRHLVSHALDQGFSPAKADVDLRINDAGFSMAEGLLSSLDEYPLPPTRGPRYAGAAKQIVTERFGLATADWMQDWPCEVCDPDRVDEFIAFYDEVADDSVRFDTMLLTLESCELRGSLGQPLGAAADWLARTLRRDFALHGHSIHYWACLDHEADDPDFRSDRPQFVWRMSGLVRRVWEDSLRPIDVVHPHLGHSR